MIQIMIDETTAKAISEAADQIELVDPNGNRVGVCSASLPEPLFTDEDIALAKQALAAPGPRRPFSETIRKLEAQDNE